jgi:ferritin-like metal-binding protein YciE
VAPLNTLQDLLVTELRELRDAELQLSEALPRFAQAAGNETLKLAIQQHCTESLEHVTRLDEIFTALGLASDGERSEAISGLIRSCDVTLHHRGDPGILDAALIYAVRRIEQFEVGSYCHVIELAKLLSLNDATATLGKTLAEEQAAEQALADLAEYDVHPSAPSTAAA